MTPTQLDFLRQLAADDIGVYTPPAEPFNASLNWHRGQQARAAMLHRLVEAGMLKPLKPVGWRITEAGRAACALRPTSAPDTTDKAGH